MASKGQVRPATAMDSVNIVRLLKTQYAESAARYLAPFDDQRALQFVSAIIGKNGFAIVVEASGRLLGTAAIAPVPLPFCGLPAMTEAWFAVVAKCRDQDVPKQLIDELGRFMDTQASKLALILGSTLLAPPTFDRMLSTRKDLKVGRGVYVRLPNAAVAEGEAA